MLYAYHIAQSFLLQNIFHSATHIVKVKLPDQVASVYFIKSYSSLPNLYDFP